MAAGVLSCQGGGDDTATAEAGLEEQEREETRQACTSEGLAIEIVDAQGVSPRLLEHLEVGDSPSIALRGLAPAQTVDVLLRDERGREWSYARLRADRQGAIAPTLIWYQTGVIGESVPWVRHRPHPAFHTFQQAESYLRRHRVRITVSEPRGRKLLDVPLPVKSRRSPLLFPSDARGRLVNAILARKGDLHVTGTHFPPGATVHLYVVPNRRSWKTGDPILDVSGTVPPA
jgi:hypothetical protein